jgi:hypothetical protein
MHNCLLAAPADASLLSPCLLLPAASAADAALAAAVVYHLQVATLLRC